MLLVSGSAVTRRDKAKRTEKGVTSQDVAPFLRAAAEWKGYVNVEQSDASKAQHSQFSDDVDLVSEFTAQVCLRGYRITFVQVDDEETVRATAFAAFRGMPDTGYAVSAWADSLLAALAAVVFIVAVQAQYDLSQFAIDGQGKSRRTF